MEDKLEKANKVARKHTDLVKNLAVRMEIEGDSVEQLLRLIRNDNNELVTAQLKQLFSTARLVYANEMQEIYDQRRERQRQAEERAKREAAAHAKAVAELNRIHDENVQRKHRNINLYQRRVHEVVAAFRDGVDVDRVSHEDMREITALCEATEKLKERLVLSRCGFLWSQVKIQGVSPIIKYDDPIYQFYQEKGLGEKLEEIPDHIYHHVHGHTMIYYRMMTRSGKAKMNYFKEDAY